MNETGTITSFVVSFNEFSSHLGGLSNEGFSGLPNVLRYTLDNHTLHTGDLVLLDSDGNASDVIRFEDSSVFFFSLADGTDTDAADVAALPAVLPTHVIASEVLLSDGSTGYHYVPGSSDPGFADPVGG